MIKSENDKLIEWLQKRLNKSRPQDEVIRPDLLKLLKTLKKEL